MDTFHYSLCLSFVANPVNSVDLVRVAFPHQDPRLSFIELRKAERDLVRDLKAWGH